MPMILGLAAMAQRAQEAKCNEQTSTIRSGLLHLSFGGGEKYFFWFMSCLMTNRSWLPGEFLAQLEKREDPQRY